MALYESIILKNCPFCGGKPNLQASPLSVYGDKICVYCTKCSVSTPMGELDEVISVWNKRGDTTEREIRRFLRCDDIDELEVTFQKTVTGERTVTITKWEG